MELRIATTALMMAIASMACAVQLRVHGNVTDHIARQPINEAFVRVYKNGVVQHAFHTNSSGHYSVLLDNNASYILRFSLPGHVTKCFAVDTHGPAWENDNRSVELEVEMTLFEQVQGLDLSFFDLPMGMARFTPMTGVTQWNGEYEERIRTQVERLMAEIHFSREQLAERVMGTTSAGQRQ